MSKTFPDAPLVEAVFEIRFRAELSIESARHRYYEKIKKEYPEIFISRVTDPEPPALKPYRFTNNKQTKIIQFSINRFSFHMTKEEYNQGGFPRFKRECLKHTDWFCECYKISDLKRTGLRYINHIPILREKDGSIPMSRYIKLAYELPRLIPRKFHLFNTGLVMPLGDGKLRILSQSQKLQDPEETEIIILDFDYYLESGLKANALADYLSKSHYHTKRIFLALITPDYKKAIEGGRK